MPPAATDSESQLLDRDVRLKIWVPEKVYDALTLLADEMDVSRGEWSRYALVAHLFGRLALQRALRGHTPKRGKWYDMPMFSRRPCADSAAPSAAPAPRTLPTDKATIDTVVLVSRRVRVATATLASARYMPIGRCASYVLAWSIFGRGMHGGAAARVEAGYLLGEYDGTPTPRGDAT